MASTPMRFLGAAAWPLTIWTSLTNFGDHPADDYVERTFPIVATAIAFWICVAGLIYLNTSGAGGVAIGMDDGEAAVRLSRRGAGVFTSVLMVFAPLLYITGFWLFNAREERFPR
ncbi:MAG TPA: hypothetical protein PLN53_11055 [Terricaulis sp.]|nr:hypothetical protein [Terricaulis sp.]